MYGSPYFGVMTIGRNRGAGAIVMATHGRGGVTRALLGSVATATIRQTDVPLMLVRPDAIEYAPTDVATTPARTRLLPLPSAWPPSPG